MNAVCEFVEAEKVLYKRGCVSQYLTGANASLYRQMIWKYGKAEATEQFWWLWHKNEGSLDSNHHEAVKANLQ